MKTIQYQNNPFLPLGASAPRGSFLIKIYKLELIFFARYGTI